MILQSTNACPELYLFILVLSHAYLGSQPLASKSQSSRPKPLSSGHESPQSNSYDGLVWLLTKARQVGAIVSVGVSSHVSSIAYVCGGVISILLQGGNTSDGSDDGNGSGGGEGDLDLLRDDDGKGDSGGEDGDSVDGHEIPLRRPYRLRPDGPLTMRTPRKRVRIPVALPPTIEADITEKINAPPHKRVRLSSPSTESPSSPPLSPLPSSSRKRSRSPSPPPLPLP
nr:hypothetical protein [Tanacetum cinerariifolium]